VTRREAKPHKEKISATFGFTKEFRREANLTKKNKRLRGAWQRVKYVKIFIPIRANPRYKKTDIKSVFNKSISALN